MFVKFKSKIKKLRLKDSLQETIFVFALIFNKEAPEIFYLFYSKQAYLFKNMYLNIYDFYILMFICNIYLNHFHPPINYFLVSMTSQIVL